MVVVIAAAVQAGCNTIDIVDVKKMVNSAEGLLLDAELAAFSAPARILQEVLAPRTLHKYVLAGWTVDGWLGGKVWVRLHMRRSCLPGAFDVISRDRIFSTQRRQSILPLTPAPSAHKHPRTLAPSRLHTRARTPAATKLS